MLQDAQTLTEMMQQINVFKKKKREEKKRKHLCIIHFSKEH